MQTHNSKNIASTPLTVNSLDELEWHDSADVVVVGYGGAGVCTALSACEAGASVIAIERFGGGGATALSGGIVYGGATSYQAEAGIEDSAEEMFKYLKQETGDIVREETLRRFCDSSAENFEWLKSHGVNFGNRLFEGKRSYPPKGYDIYFSGNELSPQIKAIAKPAARGHRAVGEGYTGQEFFEGLSQSAAAKKAISVMTHTRVSRLVVDNSGQVVGVEVKQLPKGSQALELHKKIIKKVNDFERFFEKKAMARRDELCEIEQASAQTHYIRAVKGVVLTTGSFTFNREMVRHYAPKFSEAMPLGTIGCNGDGIRLGMGLGAGLGRMDSVTAWRTISPPESFVKSVVVNKNGRRFISEDAYLGHLGGQMAEQPEQKAWLIIDSRTYWGAFKDALPRFGEESYLELRGPILINLLFNNRRAKTLEALAEKVGIDPKGLTEEVAQYNQAVASGEDWLGKKASNQRIIGKGWYTAIDISTGSKKFPCVSIPMGGMTVDEGSGQVQRSDGSPIVGLYAAGRGVVAIPTGFYVSGLSLADCVFSGRRAGYSVARNQ